MNQGERTGSSRLELLGGLECTINRVGKDFYDQFEASGHYHRHSDLELLLDLGVKRLRYPVLWERVQSRGADSFEWSFADERLRVLRELGIEPIVGLLHHGSGPKFTNLLDPEFPEKLAKFAREVAERYPWVRSFTPVNEPLTTARFSALYGLWYPHARSPKSFLTALLNQCRATVLAMRSIREIIPDAKLIQTEDLGKTHSSPSLQYQADFENERRWFTYDLLCGRALPEACKKYAESMGIAQRELAWFEDNPCPQTFWESTIT